MKDAAKSYRNVLQMQEGDYPFEPGAGNLGKHRAKSKRLNEQLGKYSLTEKQSRVLEFIREHVDTVGFPPTVRQIAIYYGISAKAAHDHLRAIAKKGYLRLFPGSARGMELVRPEEDSAEQELKTALDELTEEVQPVPLLGSIAAGTPILAEENIESRLAFPKSFLPTSGDMFALTVKGDSMEEAGILDGDIAVLSKVQDVATEVKSGDIVAALLDGEATLKTFERKGKKVELLPENQNYERITLAPKDNALIVGRLVGVYRRYRA